MSFLPALTRLIENAPAANRRELLIAIDLYWQNRPPLLPEIPEIEWLEAIVEGLSEEIAHVCYFDPTQEN